MKKLLAVALWVMFLTPVAASQIHAVEKATQAGVVDVGNKLCPVSGDTVSGKNFVIYEGKRYGLCCPMCEAPFRKNPEKYIAAMQQGKPATGMAMTTNSDAAKSENMRRGMEQRDF